MLGSAGTLGAISFLLMQLGCCMASGQEHGIRSADPFIAYRASMDRSRQAPLSRLPSTRQTVLAFHQQDFGVGSAAGSRQSGELRLTDGYPGSDDSRIISADGSWLSPPSQPLAGASFMQRRACSRSRCCEAKCKIFADYRNYYCWLTMRDLLLGVSMASVFANTSMDQDIRDWYQEDVRSSSTDDLAAFWKVFGEGNIFIPSFAIMALADGLLDIEEGQPGYHVGQFSDRVLRGYLVGAPPMLFMQAALGGSRPGEKSYESRWRPFADNNAVSGHGFVGAVPFLTAGRMIEDDHPCMAGCLYFFSTLPAWSRVNDDAHYFSQACLGWWMAYLACRAVDDTEQEYRHLTFSPLAMNDTVGIQAVFQR